MRVTVRFADGEELEGESEAASLQKMGFPVMLKGGNNRLVWVSLAAIKYVIMHGGNREKGGPTGDPRANQGLTKVVLHFLDGDTMRTYQDDTFGQEGEGFNIRLWDPKLRALVRVVISLHALKGIFFVEEWDSRTIDEKQAHATRRKNKQQAIPTAWLHEEGAFDVDPEIRKLAHAYQRRLALATDVDMGSRDSVIFEKAIRQNLDRLLDEDLVALNPNQKNQLVSLILREAVGFGPLDPLLADPAISEIMVNGPDEIFIERQGQILRTQIHFDDNNQLMNVIRRMAQSIGRRVDESSPMVDARLPDGSRLNAVIPPASMKGPVLTIRKFKSFGMGTDDLVREGTLSPAMAAFLEGAVQGRLSILISGGTGSGKTTTMNVMGSMIPPRERVVTIEDSAELQLRHPHVVGLEYRPPNVEGKGELTIRHLLRNSLRMRPDRVLVGEVRGAEALDMLQAMNTGHDGSMSTIHSNSARDAFSRLETMVLAGSVELPMEAVRAQISSAVNLVLQQSRMPDGSRKIIQIAEVKGYDPQGRPVLEDIYRYRRGTDGVGVFEATGLRPKGLEKMNFYDVQVPDELFDPTATLVLAKDGPVRESIGELEIGREEQDEYEVDLEPETASELDDAARVLQSRKGERRKIQTPIAEERRNRADRRAGQAWDPYAVTAPDDGEAPNAEMPALPTAGGGGGSRGALHRRAQEKGRRI